MQSDQPPYRLRVYGLPRVDDQYFSAEHQGIAAGRRALESRLREPDPDHQHGTAELIGLSGVSWSAYIGPAGALIETYQREPGSDDQ